MTSAAFAALIREAAVPWATVGMTPDELLRTCDENGVTGLVAAHLRRRQRSDWPAAMCDALDSATRVGAAAELLRARELQSVLTALASQGVFPILVKGTALAYSVYDHPASRPRADTDLFVGSADVPGLRRVMVARGYTVPTQCNGDVLFGQFPLRRRDEFGLMHALDVHWKLSTQSVFATLLTFDELAAHAVPLPGLGRLARAAGLQHALLLACIHPVMHHRNAASLLWLHDVHLLASRLTEPDFHAFADMAIAKGVAAICAHQLGAAHRLLGTRIPSSALRALNAVRPEPSAAYLRPHRHWVDELMSNLGGLPRWSDRFRLLREVVLPSPAYMLAVYALAPPALGKALLPILYLHRLGAGCLKILAGQK